jgi:hypothetical protein
MRPVNMRRGIARIQGFSFLPGSRPVFPRETGRSVEFASVGRDERGVTTPSLASDEHIVRPNRLPGAFKFGAYGAGLSRIVFIEVHPLQRAGDERVETLGNWPPGVDSS